MISTRSYWTAVWCGFLVLTIGLGVRQSFGIFLKPVSAELNVGRELFSFGTALSMLLMGAVAPFAGRLCDRFGSAPTIAGGGVLYVLGMVVTATMHDGFMLVLGNILVGIGLSAASFGPVLGVILRVAPPAKVALAVGICSAGGSFGQFFIVPLAAVLQNYFGDWRPTMWALPAYISDKGIGLSLFGYNLSPAELGGWAIGMVGLFNIAGAILWSSMGGRYKRKNLLALLYLLRSAVFLGFVLAPLSAASVLVFSAALGFLWLGTVPLTTALVGFIFGPVHLTMLNGIVFFGHQVGSFFGGWGGGRLFDLQGNYDLMWWISIALGVISALLHWPIVEEKLARPAAPVAQPA